ncbi:cytochrome c6 PetJ [Synechococcus elongatus]|uniref:Cytochrome c6 n=1 Tax=Synechococcus elongatus PCC 11802 TaxID=2283154 RepID=A0AAT9JYU9_SYNEL|nr:c-type cytochrome [Synechococcus elongatus]QFZ91387.1 c-type cytochrome [Synechococcus elongatus PCC 11802]
MIESDQQLRSPRGEGAVGNGSVKRWLIALGLVISLILGGPQRAIAADLQAGAKLFQNNCAACHWNGGNVINGQKTLRQEALRRYGMDSLAALQRQITNGKNAMPAFGQRLSSEQIEAIAAYVFDRAQQGWTAR